MSKTGFRPTQASAEITHDGGIEVELVGTDAGGLEVTEVWLVPESDGPAVMSAIAGYQREVITEWTDRTDRDDPDAPPLESHLSEGALSALASVANLVRGLGTAQPA